jgi:hypothetical protein
MLAHIFARFIISIRFIASRKKRRGGGEAGTVAGGILHEDSFFLWGKKLEKKLVIFSHGNCALV